MGLGWGYSVLLSGLGQVPRHLPSAVVPETGCGQQGSRSSMGGLGSRQHPAAGHLLLLLAEAKGENVAINSAANETKYHFPPGSQFPQGPSPSASCSPAVSLRDTTLPGLKCPAVSQDTATSCFHTPLRTQVSRLLLPIPWQSGSLFYLAMGSATSSRKLAPSAWQVAQGVARGAKNPTI